MATPGVVREIRLVLTVDDFDAALAFYRDSLGLRYDPQISSEGGRVAMLHADHVTLELADEGHASYIDDLEVGRRVAGQIRVAFAVDDAAACSAAMVEAGAELVAPATPTPWGSMNARLDAPGPLHITVYSGE
jgi:lactoylglutathione lyase